MVESRWALLLAVVWVLVILNESLRDFRNSSASCANVCDIALTFVWAEDSIKGSNEDCLLEDCLLDDEDCLLEDCLLDDDDCLLDAPGTAPPLYSVLGREGYRL